MKDSGMNLGKALLLALFLVTASGCQSFKKLPIRHAGVPIQSDGAGELFKLCDPLRYPVAGDDLEEVMGDWGLAYVYCKDKDERLINLIKDHDKKYHPQKGG